MPTCLDLLAPQFEEQLRQYKEEDSFLELVRRTIQDKLTGHRPSIDAISKALHMGLYVLYNGGFRTLDPASNASWMKHVIRWRDTTSATQRWS